MKVCIPTNRERVYEDYKNGLLKQANIDNSYRYHKSNHRHNCH